eukprot:Skav235952  [mRNA]  locus=scaffold530:214338:214703:+ [translate_table: standard]
MAETGGYDWSSGQVNGYPFAKYFNKTRSDYCSWTVTPTLAAAAQLVAASIGANWENQSGGEQRKTVTQNKEVAGKLAAHIIAKATNSRLAEPELAKTFLMQVAEEGEAGGPEDAEVPRSAL